MEIGTVKQVDINHEMQGAYLDYAMSVIVARALPDVRDGLKPVHRRILYAMHDMRLTPDKPYRKSARIVGEVLGKYHPHGDAAVYDSMVRMAQDFSMRYTLVDGQGNFGSIDGDEAAAMRYTEARMDEIATDMLADIEKGTVAFGPNFDGTLDEPLVLPSALPNFLVNGAYGIAVGMATNVPPHNLREVVDALCFMIDRYGDLDGVGVEDLMRFIKGPDFPTGGIVYRYGESDGAEDGRNDVIQAAYAVGRGRITVQALAQIEPMTLNRSRIVVTELPYQVNKTRLIERIADLARDGKLEGVVDLRDESDRQGMRLVIELTRTTDPQEMLAKLYKLTPMRTTFGINMLALVDGEPRTLSLKRSLWYYLEHRQEIVTRRTEYDLDKARRQAHILEGLLIALDNLDDVINIIRRSQNAETAKANLMKKLKLTDIQAQAILDLPLRRLAALERKKIRDEYKEKLALIACLEDLLGDPHKILAVIRKGLLELKEKYGDDRRTQLVSITSQAATVRDLMEEEDTLILASGNKIWREALEERRRGTAVGSDREGVALAIAARTTGDVVFFTAAGMGAVTPVHRVPQGARRACSLGEIVNASVSASPVAAVFLPAEKRGSEDGGHIFLAAASGKVKRVTISDVYTLAARGLAPAMGIEAPDRLIGALLTEANEDIMLISSAGQAIRFAQDEVRPMGLPAAGVAGIKLGEGETVVGLGLARPKSEMVIVTERGYAKRTPVDECPTQKRYGNGVVAAKVSARLGPVAGGGVLETKDEFFVVTEKGQVKGSTLTSVPALRRSAQGRAFMTVGARDRVIGLIVTEHPTTPASRKAASDEPAEESPAPVKPPATRTKSAGKRASTRKASTKKAATRKPSTVAKKSEATPKRAKASSQSSKKASGTAADVEKVVQLAMDVSTPEEKSKPARREKAADAPESKASKRSAPKKASAADKESPAEKRTGSRAEPEEPTTSSAGKPEAATPKKPAAGKPEAATPKKPAAGKKKPSAQEKQVAPKGSAAPSEKGSQPRPRTSDKKSGSDGDTAGDAKARPAAPRARSPRSQGSRSRIVTSVPKQDPARKKK